MRKHTAIGISCAVAITAGGIAAGASQAAGGQGTWSQWSSTSASPKTMTIAAKGFASPTATYVTDAESLSRPTADFLNADTPPGERFGTSQGERLLRMGLQNTSTDDPSTTTYTFTEPTPVGHFAFVLGDIDVDEVRISAVTADGSPATAGDLGFRATFNFCNGRDPFPLTCEDKTWTTEPEWRPGSLTLRGSTPGDETEGASGWFLPTASLKSLTFRFSKLPLGGNPTYRTWFVGDDVREPDPTPSPTSPSPTSPSPTATGQTPTPTPTTPTPEPTVRTEIPLKIVTSGTTVPSTGSTVVVKSIKTKGRVTQRTRCAATGTQAAGEVRLCTHSFNRARGTVTVRTFGRSVKITVTITSTPQGTQRQQYVRHTKRFQFRTG